MPKRRWKRFDPDELSWSLWDKCDFNSFLKWPSSYEGNFPTIEIEGSNWHDHLPLGWDLMDREKTSRDVQRVCVETLLNAYTVLQRNKPESDEPIRVIALVTLPDLWHSSLDVFFDEHYFSRFFDRNGFNDPKGNDFQQWTPVGEKRSLIREWGLATDIAEMGYYTYRRDMTCEPPDEVWAEVWALGEIH